MSETKDWAQELAETIFGNIRTAHIMLETDELPASTKAKAIDLITILVRKESAQREALVVEGLARKLEFSADLIKSEGDVSDTQRSLMYSHRRRASEIRSFRPNHAATLAQIEREAIKSVLFNIICNLTDAGKRCHQYQSVGCWGGKCSCGLEWEDEGLESYVYHIAKKPPRSPATQGGRMSKIDELLKSINQVEKVMHHSNSCDNRSANGLGHNWESCNRCRLQYALAKFEETQ